MQIEPKEVLKRQSIENLPKTSGYYIVYAKTLYSTNCFAAYFNGKSFDVNNQEILYWYE